MSRIEKYTITSDETQFEENSNGLVLKNQLSINNATEMELYETQYLVETAFDIASSSSLMQPITVQIICNWHKQWLGNIYSWAGNYRNVNMSKDNFMFAAAHLVPQLMSEFENNILTKYTPCTYEKDSDFLKAIAITHVEFILIHPFREGNGRLGRLLMSLMVLIN